MKNVNKSRINAVQNAATFLRTIDMFSGLSQAECDDHHAIGQLMEIHAKEVAKFLININKQ